MKKKDYRIGSWAQFIELDPCNDGRREVVEKYGGNLRLAWRKSRNPAAMYWFVRRMRERAQRNLFPIEACQLRDLTFQYFREHTLVTYLQAANYLRKITPERLLFVPGTYRIRKAKGGAK